MFGVLLSTVAQKFNFGFIRLEHILSPGFVKFQPSLGVFFFCLGFFFSLPFCNQIPFLGSSSVAATFSGSLLDKLMSHLFISSGKTVSFRNVIVPFCIWTFNDCLLCTIVIRTMLCLTDWHVSWRLYKTRSFGTFLKTMALAKKNFKWVFTKKKQPWFT